MGTKLIEILSGHHDDAACEKYQELHESRHGIAPQPCKFKENPEQIPKLLDFIGHYESNFDEDDHSDEADLNNFVRNDLSDEADLNNFAKNNLSDEADLSNFARNDLSFETDLNNFDRNDLPNEEDLNNVVRKFVSKKRLAPLSVAMLAQIFEHNK